MRLLNTLLFSLVLALPAAAEPLRLPDMGDPSSLALSPSEERALGEAVMDEVRRRVPLEQDLEINGYIADLGQRLASHVSSEQDLHFFVVDDPAINAFALPGGHIGINTGLLLQAESESELASVLAHEIAHVTQRHIARRIAASEGSTLRTAALLVAAVLIGSQNPQAGSAAAMAGMAGSLQQQLNYSRQHEQEADRIGMQILTAAGFDPIGMPHFFERLLRIVRYQNRPPEYLSTHPVSESRIADTYFRAKQQREGSAFESPLFGLMRNRLQALKAARGPEAVRSSKAALEMAQGEEAEAARYGLALVLTREGDYGRARELLTALLERHGEHAPYYAALGDLERAAGHLERSLTLYRQGLSLYPGHAGLTAGYAQALDQAGRSEQAWRELNRLIQDGSRHAELLRELARLAERAQRPVEARLALAQHYHLKGDLRSALSQLEQVLQAGQADHYQKSRAAAYREAWQQAAARRQRS